MPTSFNIGQYRKEKNRKYFTKRDYEIVRKKRWVDRGDRSFEFGDPYLIPKQSFKAGEHYHLSFSLHRYTTDVRIYLQLQADSESVNPDNVQTIQTIVIPKTTTIEINPVQFDVVFTPNGDYKELGFFVYRDLVEDDEPIYVDIRIPDILEFGVFNNIIDDKFPTAQVLKLGVQGEPGMLMCLNGEGIKIGRSGLYEMFNNEIILDFIGVNTNGDMNNQYFMMDYQYEVGK